MNKILQMVFLAALVLGAYVAMSSIYTVEEVEQMILMSSLLVGEKYLTHYKGSLTVFYPISVTKSS